MTLADAMKGKPKVNFTPPSGKIVYGDQRAIPNVRCMPVEEARSRLRAAGFDVYVEANRVPSPCPPGTAAGTVPSGSTIKGGTVGIQVSAGQPRPQPSTRPSTGADRSGGQGNQQGDQAESPRSAGGEER